jgi:predicted dehydrogenase
VSELRGESATPAHLPPLPRGPVPGIGCVGAGFIMADCHLVAYAQAGIRPRAITSRRPEAAAAVAARHGIPRVHATLESLLEDPAVEVLDIAVPPDVQPSVIDTALSRSGKIRGILAQKPLAPSLAEARLIVEACEAAGVRLVVNQNMRFDHAVRACRGLLAAGRLGEPVLATIEMRAIPHWMPWQERLGWVTLRIMSIHHLDAFRHWFGDPARVIASVRPDPRTARSFAHEDGICLTILEYDRGVECDPGGGGAGLRCLSLDDVWAGPAREGAEADCGVSFRVEGTLGMAKGTIGWPAWPERRPSTLDWTTTAGGWHRPRWSEAWFPDAFIGPLAELLRDLEGTEPAACTGRDHLTTLAVVEAAYRSAREHRAVSLREAMA